MAYSVEQITPQGLHGQRRTGLFFPVRAAGTARHAMIWPPERMTRNTKQLTTAGALPRTLPTRETTEASS